MFKQTILAVFLLISISSFSQDFSNLWEGYFSYFNVKDVTEGNDKVYAAAENAIFSYDLLTNELETITTIEGLSGRIIQTIEYSEEFQLLMIGYDNGLIEIYFESNSEILSVVDILEKESISPGLKGINHFNEYNGLVYISTDYGISAYDLNRLEFGDTYFIGNGGTQIKVNQTTILNNEIYAACSNNGGVRKALLDMGDLIDYQQWQGLTVGGDYVSIQRVEDKVYTVRSNKALFEVLNNNLNQLFVYTDLPIDTRKVNTNLVITTENDVFVYDENFNLIENASVNSEFDTQFTTATIVDSQVYIGTISLGILQTHISNTNEYISIKPDGPTSNTAFKIQSGINDLWVTYGDYTEFFNSFPLRQRGLSYLSEEQWNNIPFDSLLTARNLVDIAINPFNPNQVFISSFKDGILEMNNGEATILYNQDNSGLESLFNPNFPNFIGIRQSASQFDASGVMWTLTSKVKKPLKSYDPNSGQWQAFSFEEIIPNEFDELGFGDLALDANGNKWIASYSNGVIGYSSTGEIKKLFSEEQNMPSSVVKSVAIDDRNQLWIGTFKGLRVLYNTSNFFDDPDPTASTIVILDDGIPTELLSNQFITDIKVDGSNNKWVGTLDSGIFYFSPDGQETIYHFTTSNSPLPSNSITDISIDPGNGRVYISTSRGLVSFSSGGTKPEEELENAYVYPNPVRPEYNILGSNDLNNINNGIKIKGLTENVNIKITDIEGNLVTEAQSRVNLRSSKANYNFAIDGGTAIWNGKNLGNNIVASGVYLVLISDLDSFETKVLKLLIVR
ncbi:type IX secretion system anionic LPS delivery protein PorZ [Ichthyenterobacterium magnum]|nr:ABC transporter substrate-binding protein [Ichthyenterobacterium magnum]